MSIGLKTGINGLEGALGGSWVVIIISSLVGLTIIVTLLITPVITCP